MKLFGIHKTWKISTCVRNESVMIELLELSERNLKEVIKNKKEDRNTFETGKIENLSKEIQSIMKY